LRARLSARESWGNLDDAAADEHHIHLPSRPGTGTIDDRDAAEDKRPVVRCSHRHEGGKQ